MITTKAKPTKAKPTKAKPTTAQVAGAACGRVLLKTATVARLVKAADTLALREFVRHYATWRDEYRDLTTIDQRNQFLHGVAGIVSEATGAKIILP